MWPFNNKAKAPDLSPAIAPKGYVFYVEPHKYSRINYIVSSDPSPESVSVYLFTEQEAEDARYRLSTEIYHHWGSPITFMGIKREAFWIENDQVETKKWINYAMHECLKTKRAAEEEQAKIEALTGFYPPKEM